MNRNTIEKTGYQVGAVTAVLAFLALGMAVLYGWVLNLVWLFNADSGDSVGQIIVSVVGVIIPIIGAVHGWIV